MTEETKCSHCGTPLAIGGRGNLCPKCMLKRGLEPNTAGFTADEPEASPRWAPPKPEELAARFPELEILELIGRGGMGAVYKARQKNLDRLVALKILPPEIGRDPAFAERFAREAQALARLSHPHIVAIHDFGQRDGLFFFLMEYMDGLNLCQLMASGNVSPKEALAIVPQICDALQFAHDHGIVHRDIKPENILLDRRGQVKIADFGLAKLTGRPAAAATAEQVIGTPQYMAPEQTEHPSEVDHRADIYSLGVVFYQMLTGELPLGKFEPPSHKVLIDVRLDEVVLRALEKEPDRRYQQASEVKTEVETILTTPPRSSAGVPPALSAAPPSAGAKRSWLAPALWIVAGVMVVPVLLVGIALCGILWGTYEAIHRPAVTRELQDSATKMANAMGPLDVTTDMPPRWVCRALVAEAEIADVEVGQEVRMVLDAFPGLKFQGKVAQVAKAPVAAQNVVLYEATIDIADPDPRFKVGMSVNAWIIVAHREDVHKTPSAAKASPAGESKPSFEEANAAALQIIRSRALWPQSPEALCKEFWAARARKDYEELKVLWPGSASFDWEFVCRHDANVTYVFGAWDGQVVAYATEEYYRQSGSYNMKMLLGSIETAKGKRYYVISGN